MLPCRPDEEIVFFGGKDYLRLLRSLTGETPNRKTLFYNAPASRRRRGGSEEIRDEDENELALRMCRGVSGFRWQRKFERIRIVTTER
jgi:hypothetical protein